MRGSVQVVVLFTKIEKMNSKKRKHDRFTVINVIDTTVFQCSNFPMWLREKQKSKLNSFEQFLLQVMDRFDLFHVVHLAMDLVFPFLDRPGKDLVFSTKICF